MKRSRVVGIFCLLAGLSGCVGGPQPASRRVEWAPPADDPDAPRVRPPADPFRAPAATPRDLGRYFPGLKRGPEYVPDFGVEPPSSTPAGETAGRQGPRPIRPGEAQVAERRVSTPRLGTEAGFADESRLREAPRREREPQVDRASAEVVEDEGRIPRLPTAIPIEVDPSWRVGALASRGLPASRPSRPAASPGSIRVNENDALRVDEPSDVDLAVQAESTPTVHQRKVVARAPEPAHVPPDPFADVTSGAAVKAEATTVEPTVDAVPFADPPSVARLPVRVEPAADVIANPVPPLATPAQTPGATSIPAVARVISAPIAEAPASNLPQLNAATIVPTPGATAEVAVKTNASPLIEVSTTPVDPERASVAAVSTDSETGNLPSTVREAIPAGVNGELKPPTPQMEESIAPRIIEPSLPNSVPPVGMGDGAVEPAVVTPVVIAAESRTQAAPTIGRQILDVESTNEGAIPTVERESSEGSVVASTDEAISESGSPEPVETPTPMIIRDAQSGSPLLVEVVTPSESVAGAMLTPVRDGRQGIVTILPTPPELAPLGGPVNESSIEVATANAISEVDRRLTDRSEPENRVDPRLRAVGEAVEPPPAVVERRVLKLETLPVVEERGATPGGGRSSLAKPERVTEAPPRRSAWTLGLPRLALRHPWRDGTSAEAPPPRFPATYYPTRLEPGTLVQPRSEARTAPVGLSRVEGPIPPPAKAPTPRWLGWQAHQDHHHHDHGPATPSTPPPPAPTRILEDAHRHMHGPEPVSPAPRPTSTDPWWRPRFLERFRGKSEPKPAAAADASSGDTAETSDLAERR